MQPRSFVPHARNNAYAYRQRGLRRLGAAHQRLDPIGDLLSRLAELRDGPVSRVAFDDVVGAGVVDQPLGERGGQHQLAFGDGDETVPQSMEPEFRAAGLTYTRVEMMWILDVAGGACR